MAEASRRRRGGKKANGKKNNGKAKRAAANSFEETYSQLLNLGKKLSGASSVGEDVVADVITALLGSVPAVAVGETMLTASQAQGQMLSNAVANQHKTNIVAMVATVGCVAQLLDLNPAEMWQDAEHEEREEEKKFLDELKDLIGKRDG